MIRAYVVSPTGEWLHLEDNEMYFDVIKRSGFLNDFQENEPNAYEFFKKLGYTDDDIIKVEDEEAFDNIEFKFNQRAVIHALKKGVLRIRYFKEGDINRSGEVILLAGDINRITSNVIETAFKKFNVLNTTTLIIEDCEANEIFKGTYDNYEVYKNCLTLEESD
jgi:hypothetical protein